MADRFKVPYTIIMGTTEVRDETAIVRNMQKGTQEIVPFEKVVEEIKRMIGEENLDTYSPGEVVY